MSNYFGNRCYGCTYYDGFKNYDALRSIVKYDKGITARISSGCSEFEPDSSATCLRNCIYTEGLMFNCSKGHARKASSNDIEYCYDYAYKEQEESSYSPKKGCFITTTICDNLGKSDNCYELTTLRNFCDNYLLKDNQLKDLVFEYYKISPSIVDRINSNKNKISLSNLLMNDYIMKVIYNIEMKEYTKAITIYKDMIVFLKNNES